MKKSNILFLAITGISLFGFITNNAIGKNDKEASKNSDDAVVRAQEARAVEKKGIDKETEAHDKSDIFKASNATPLSDALKNQPDNGKISGFDFYRDA